MKASLGSIALGALLLAGCGNEAQRTADDGRTASGEVLGGTISDDMLPLDTLQSQSPPLREAVEGPSESDDEQSDGDASGQADTASPTPPPTAQAEPVNPPDED